MKHIYMSENRNIHERVSNIVNNNGIYTEDGLSVNPASNFVVVTYWWGHGNDNRNMARPCADFYEDYIKKVNKFMVNLIYSSVQKVKIEHAAKMQLARQENNNDLVGQLEQNLQKEIALAEAEVFRLLEQSGGKRFPSLMNLVFKMVKHYMENICEHYNIEQKALTPCKRLFQKKDGNNVNPAPVPAQNIPALPTAEELFTKAFDSLIAGIMKNKDNLIALSKVQTEFDELKTAFMAKREASMRNQTRGEDIKELAKVDKVKVNQKQKEKSDLQKALITTLKRKGETNKSTFDELIDTFQYIPPTKFESMIEEWKDSCRNNNCNYLAVEYKEFAQPGGYQLAINAKPKFIQKALEICGGKAVLYIDGDMLIQNYPGIFDMKDVDFMARGWWIDPRSSWKMTESIMYDPYNFETSGGTMFFNNTVEADKLLDLWVETAEKEINAGKADDRVLSLVFNTKGVLTWIRMIQLPVEYLWLSLDYNERMMTEVYDYNVNEMKSTVLIEHPHCLTSEDTATGAGASNDRQPKFYDFLEDVFPCSETTHEYIMFRKLIEENGFVNNGVVDETLTEYMGLSNEARIEKENTIKQSLLLLNQQIGDPAIQSGKREKLKQQRELQKKELNKTLYLPFFYWYYHFMGDVKYLDDGNADLYDLGFVEPDDEDGEDNTQPLSIISYKNKFGNKPHPSGEGLSVNKVVDVNMKYANDPESEGDLKTNSNVVVSDNNGFKVIVPSDSTYTTDKSFIRLLLKYLTQGESIIINPLNQPDYNEALYRSLREKMPTLYGSIDFVFSPDLDITVRRSTFYKPKINMNQPILLKPDDRLIDFISMQLSLEEFSLFLYKGSYEFMSLVRIAYLKNTKPAQAPAMINEDAEEETKSESFMDSIMKPVKSMVMQRAGGYIGNGKYNPEALLDEYNDSFEKLFAGGNKRKRIKSKKPKTRKPKTRKPLKRRTHKNKLRKNNIN